MGTVHRIAATRWWAIVVTAVVGLVLSVAPSAAAATVTIHINGGLDPASVTVPPNTEVTFVNDDGGRHRMRSTGGPIQFDSGGSLDGAGTTFTVTVTALGTYTYRDERNSQSAAFQGTIVVSDTVTTTVPGSPTTVAPPPPMTASVSIGDRIYSPSSVTVAPGGTVTFTNNDGRAHTVTATDRSWDSGLMNPGAVWSKTFPNGGTFSYFCDLHPDMTGRVVVSAGGAQPPTTPPPTTPPTTRPPTIPPTTPAPTTTLPGTPPPTQASVMIMDFQYSPTSVTIAAGGTVTWTNHDSAPHTVTADDASYDSGMMRTGGTWSKTFATPGTYRYHCDYHPEMVATVVVLAPGATVPPGGSPVTTVAGGGSGGSGGSVGGTTATTVAGGGSGGTGGSGGSGGSAATGGTTGGSGVSLPTTGSVAISGNKFAPASITIAVGGTVTWTNSDAVPHTVTADDGSFDSGLMRKGGTWSKTFTAPGTYTYFCSLHPEMTGTVVVATPEDPTPAVVTGGGGSHSGHGATGTTGAAASTASTGGAGGAGGPTAAGSATVSMANNQFQPVSVTVGVGGVVTWTNTDTIPHTVTADDGSFDSDILMPGQTFSYQFETPGTVTYKCILHAGMAGEVVVSELPADPAAAHAAHADAAAAEVAVPAESSERVISITGGTFPAVTVLAAGHSVTWRNDDTVAHDVQALYGEFSSGELQPGEEFTFTFEEAGVHPYTCDLHQHMGGTIIVMPADDVDLANSPTVAVTDTGFDPPNLTVHQGTTVVWAFGGQLPHTVTADDGSFDSGVLEPGQTFTFTFDELGEFHYTCILHPMMMGTITVVPADATIDEAATSADGSAVPAAAAGDQGESGNGAARIDGGGIGTPIVVGFGVGGGLLAAVLLALGVGVLTRRTAPHLA